VSARTIYAVAGLDAAEAGKTMFSGTYDRGLGWTMADAQRPPSITIEDQRRAADLRVSGGSSSDVSADGDTGWWSQQSTAVKAGIVLGALAVVGVGGFIAYDQYRKKHPAAPSSAAAKATPNRSRRRARRQR